MPDRRRYGRTPDTVFILSACILGGLAVIATGNPPPTLLTVTPHWAGMVWGWLLLLSSVTTLAGVYWRDELYGWALELSGRITHAVVMTLYAAALAGAIDDGGAWLVGALIGGAALASWWRVRQLTRRLSQWTAALQRANRAARHRGE